MYARVQHYAEASLFLQIPLDQDGEDCVHKQEIHDVDTGLLHYDTEQTMSIAATTENIEEAFSIEMPVEAETKEIHKANSPKDKGTKKETHEDTEQPYSTNYCRTDSANPDRDKDSKIETDVGPEEELTNVEEAIQLSPKHKDMSTVSAATVMAEQKPEEIEKEVTDDQQTIAETTSSIQLEKHLEEKIETDKSNTDRKETELISGHETSVAAINELTHATNNVSSEFFCQIDM